MKKIVLSAIAVVLSVTCIRASVPEAIFSLFRYQGADSVFSFPADNTRQYRNPILAGCYPDPSVCRKGNDFYLVTSSFCFYPGLPIFKSRDMVNWEQIGHVLNRPSQLNLDKMRISGGIYAPDITYDKVSDTFYVVCTNADGIGNFVVKTKNPEQGWSEPIRLPNVGGIDPSLFFDDDGSVYIVYNDAPKGNPRWDGHRAIWINKYDIHADKVIGTPQIIVDGGVDTTQHPVWIEGPHLYKRNGKYLLMCAEGGTGSQHSEVIFCSDSPMGPYVPGNKNPILTQRTLPEDRPYPVTCAGHADIIDDLQGNTWAVFLGCRPYAGGLYNTGRETFLLPVTWQNNLPVILPSDTPIPYLVNKTQLLPSNVVTTGNFEWEDTFSEKTLNMRWITIRTPHEQWYRLKKNGLHISAAEDSVSADKGQPALLACRQQHTNFQVQTKMNFTPKTSGNMAGLVCYQSEKYNLLFGKTVVDNQVVIVVDRREVSTQRIASLTLSDKQNAQPIYLKVVCRGGLCDFYVSFANAQQWQCVAEGVDATNLSTDIAGGFTGAVIGMFVQ